MSRIRANTITNQNANGAPNFPDGITVSGVVTATTTNQNITGDLTVTGNIGVGGTITYEDVTNVDSVGIITARAGVNVVGNDLNVGSNIKIGNASGIITATSFSGSGAGLTGIDATKIITGNTEVQTLASRIDAKVSSVGILTVTASGAKVTGIVTVFGTGIDYQWQGGTSMAWWKSEDMVSTSSWPAAKGGSDANLVSSNGGTSGLSYSASDSHFNGFKSIGQNGSNGGALRTTNQTTSYWWDGNDAFTVIMSIQKDGQSPSGSTNYGDAFFVHNQSSTNSEGSWALGPFGDHTWGGQYGEMFGYTGALFENNYMNFSYPFRGLFMIRFGANYDYGELSVNGGSGWHPLEMRHSGPSSMHSTFKEMSILANAGGSGNHSAHGKITEWAYWRNKRLSGVELECVTRHWCEKFQF